MALLTFRAPDLDDVDAAMQCLAFYSREAYQAQKNPVDWAVMRDSLTRLFTAGNFMRVAGFDENLRIHALTFGFVGNTFWAEPCTAFDLFYVTPEHRGTPAARQMLEAALAQLRSVNCGYVYAGAESGMGERNEKLFNNLFRRHGFVDVGGGRLLLDMRG